MTTELCGHPKTSGEGTCRHEAGWGTDHLGYGHCRFHSGSSPSGRKYGQRLKAEATMHQLEGELAEALNDRFPSYDDPIDGLLEVVSRTGMMMRLCGDLVGELHPGREWGDRQPLYAPDHQGDDTPHVLVDLYATWTERHQRACKAAVDAGVAEARVKIQQRQADMVAQVIRLTLDDLGLDDDRKSEAVQAAARHLRLVDGGQAA